MKRKIITLHLFAISLSACSQVGVNTACLPLHGTLHIDGGNDYPETRIPAVIRQFNSFIVIGEENTGGDTIAPTPQLKLNSGTLNIS